MKPLSKKKIRQLVEAAFYQVGNRRQFNIMDLGKIMAAGEAAAAAGEDITAAVSAACDKYEQKVA